MSETLITIREPLRVLLVEDDPGDIFLIREMLSEVAADWSVVEASRMSAAIELASREAFSVALLDLGLPDSQGIGTLRQLTAHSPALPVIVLTGLGDREFGVRAIQDGAQDYLVKGQINADLLSRAISHALERKKLENEKQQLISDLHKALAELKTLGGLLPICASCKKIRDDKGYWNQIEIYIAQHSQAEFSHGYCPDCARKLYPELYGPGK